MFNTIKSLIESLGYPGIIFFVFLENVFPPIPSELIIPFGGFLVEQGKMTFWLVVGSGTLGSVLGALPLYYLGRYWNRDRMKRFFNGKGSFLMVDDDNVDRSYRWFDKYGAWAVFFCRMVPGLRSYVSIPAGSAHMGMPLFLTLTAVGTALWTALLAWLGLYLGKNYQSISTYLDIAVYVILALVVGSIVWWIVKQHRKNEPDDEEHGSPAGESEPAS